TEYPGGEWAKVLVKVVPFVLILLILGVMFIVDQVKKDNDGQTENLQQNIMDYADENRIDQTLAEAVVQASPAVRDEDVQENSLENSKESADKEAPMQSMDTPSPTPYKEIMEAGKIDYSKVMFNKDTQLAEMMTYWEENNQKALDDLANLDHYIAMSWKLKGTKDFYYYGGVNSSGQPDGKGIAVYADNQYYYGDWKDGVRSGNGTWIHYHMHPTENTKDLYTYHQYTGGWADDLPEGEGSEHYDYNQSLLVEGVGYDANLIGSYEKGLIHGDFYITNLYADESTKEWNAQAQKGSWVYLNDNKDKKGNRTIHVEVSNPDNYIWMHPRDNVNIGVPCLISKNKN
ncbi:MAG: hypothetical protein K2N55_10060, partial [Lachnospiraceae bacterium]|nr:hypothetical protein [Lachnospiraceae bacterium]